MLILLTVLLLFGTAAALAVLQILRPRFRFSWLLGVAGAAAAWFSVLLWRPQLPITLAVPLWQSSITSGQFAIFIVSGGSWPYALSLTTLALAVLLSAPSRSQFPSSSSWALCLTVVGLAVLAAAADGPLTLVLFWAGLDLVEAGVVLARSENRAASIQIPFAFAARLASMALVLLAFVLGSSGEAGAGFAEIQGSTALLLPGAALIRLLAFAAPWATDSPSLRRDEVGTTLHLVAGAAAVAMLSQFRPDIGSGASGLDILGAATALYAGWMWLRAPDTFSGRPLWIMGAGSLAVAAALRGNPMGTTAWGNAMLLAGSSLFLMQIREQWMNRTVLVGLWICSAMPVALTASAWFGGGGLRDLALPALLVAQAMLLAGFFHRALHPGTEASPHMEAASLRGIYSVGIGMPLGIGVLLGIWGWPGAFQVRAPIAGAIAIFLAAIFVWSKRHFATLNPVPSGWIPPAWQAMFSSTQREARRFQASLQRAAETVTSTIEGEAGILWSLVILVLVVSLIVDRGK